MTVAIFSPPALRQVRSQVANPSSSVPASRTRPTSGPGPSQQHAEAVQPAIPVEPSLLAATVSPALDDLTETVIVAFKTAARTLSALASDITGNAREARLAACALLRLRIPDLDNLHRTTNKPNAARRPAPAARAHPVLTAAPSTHVLSPSPPAPPITSTPQPLSPSLTQSAVSAPSAPPIDPLPASSTPKHKRARLVEDIQARIADLESAINTAAEAFQSSPGLATAFTPDPLYARCGRDVPVSPAAALMALAGAPFSLRIT